jgi:outer membrane murein-binding lipoprotein Lpp
MTPEERNRYYEVFMDDMRRDQKLIAESVMALVDRLDRMEPQLGQVVATVAILEVHAVDAQRRLGGLETDVQKLDAKVDKLDTKVDKLDTKVDGLDAFAGQAQLRLERIERHVQLPTPVGPSPLRKPTRRASPKHGKKS